MMPYPTKNWATETEQGTMRGEKGRWEGEGDREREGEGEVERRERKEINIV